MFIEFHRSMIADTARNAAFYAALQRVIQPGKTTVADLGSGTGLLGFMALKLGAKDVYFYEYSPALKLSQKLARHNGLKRCHFIHAHSRSVDDPVPVDVIVSETLGNYAYEENIIENLADARRFLKPGGTLIPRHIAQFVSPVIAPRLFNELTVWDHVGYGLDFTPARTMTLNNMYVRRIPAADLLDAGASTRRWDQVDLTKKNGSLRRGNAQWDIPETTTIFGFALWWECTLLDEISLFTHPGAPATHWEQLYCPVLEPLHAERGQTLAIELVSDSRYDVGATLKWDVILRSGQQEVVRQTLDIKNGNRE